MGLTYEVMVILNNPEAYMQGDGKRTGAKIVGGTQQKPKIILQQQMQNCW